MSTIPVSLKKEMMFLLEFCKLGRALPANKEVQINSTKYANADRHELVEKWFWESLSKPLDT